MADPLQPLCDATRRAVLDGEAATDPALRRAVAAGEAPPELAALVRKIGDQAYTVADEDLGQLRSRYSEDEIFELVVAAAVGAAGRRLAAAMAALEGA